MRRKEDAIAAVPYKGLGYLIFKDNNGRLVAETVGFEENLSPKRPLFEEIEEIRGRCGEPESKLLDMENLDCFEFLEKHPEICKTFLEIPEPPSSVIIPSRIPFEGRKVPVTVIREYSFWNDFGLKSIKIPSSVTIIGRSAFDSCRSLEELKLPCSLKAIDSSAFGSCAGLRAIKIPSSVSYIGPLAFRGCDSLSIVCGVPAKPDGWNASWNPDGRPVKWRRRFFGR